MDFALALLWGLVLAILRDPVSWVVLGLSTAAGALLRPQWWVVAPGGAFVLVYVVETVREGRFGGNLTLAGTAAVLAAILALVAFFVGRLLRSGTTGSAENAHSVGRHPHQTKSL